MTETGTALLERTETNLNMCAAVLRELEASLARRDMLNHALVAGAVARALEEA